MRIEWVHPSWRDLVIEHLAQDSMARQRFLSRCTVHGAALALSVAGGRDGKRQLPLMIVDADWDALTDRLHHLLPDLNTPDLTALLSSIEQAVRRTDRNPNQAERIALARLVLERLESTWNRAKSPIPLSALAAWFALAGSLPPEQTPSPPDPARTWAELLPATPPDLTDRASTERFADWLALADLLHAHQPAELERLRFEDSHETVDDFINDVERDPNAINPAAHEHVLGALQHIRILNPWFESRAGFSAVRLQETTREQAAASYHPDPLPSHEPVAWRRFDVARVLQDL